MQPTPRRYQPQIEQTPQRIRRFAGKTEEPAIKARANLRYFIDVAGYSFAVGIYHEPRLIEREMIDSYSLLWIKVQRTKDTFVNVHPSIKGSEYPFLCELIEQAMSEAATWVEEHVIDTHEGLTSRAIRLARSRKTGVEISAEQHERNVTKRKEQRQPNNDLAAWDSMPQL